MYMCDGESTWCCTMVSNDRLRGKDGTIAYLLAEMLQRGYKCAVTDVPAEESLVG